MSVRECMARVDADELVHWQAHYLRHQWGEERQDRRAACAIYLTALAAAGGLDTKKLTPGRIMDFLNPAAVEKDPDKNLRRFRAHFQMKALTTAAQKG